VGVVDAEGVVAADVDLDPAVVVVELQDWNLGGDQVHSPGQETATLAPEKTTKISIWIWN
jgi:hypothetical protein